ncbi:hypothetical protein ACFSL6_07240 [Paenibacillus thailandensis]|uniref:DUF2759 domain-containing protein n=1 Tax=Paenibacillus thailandensis TaxID=393250 RepID=A0ABW5R2P3_9BACL
MFLAEEAAASTSTVNTFDYFMLLFTVLIFIGLIRLLRVKPNKNYFAIGWTTLSLLVFLVIDYIMIFKIWMA